MSDQIVTEQLCLKLFHSNTKSQRYKRHEGHHDDR